MEFETVLALVGLFITAAGLFYAGRQIQQTQRIARGEFILHIDDLLQQHRGIHTRLRPGGDYATGKSMPESVEDWVAIEAYMGLFERIKVLVDSRMIDIETIERLYGYRVFNIVANDTIRHNKLERLADNWRDFIELWQLLENRRQKRSM